MHFELLPLILLLLPATLATPKPQAGMSARQITRAEVVRRQARRAAGLGRRDGGPSAVTYPACNGYPLTNAQYNNPVQHAVYPGVVGPTTSSSLGLDGFTASDLDDCIQNCCGYPGTCVYAVFNTVQNQCNIYFTTGTLAQAKSSDSSAYYAAYQGQGSQYLVANMYSCTQNVEPGINSGATCCNAVRDPNYPTQ